MRKILTILLIIAGITAANAQSKHLIVYAADSSCWFIPYLNGKSQAMAPMDTFEVYLDTNAVTLGIHFIEENVADLQKVVKFGVKDTIKIYEVTHKSETVANANKAMLKIKYKNDEEQLEEIENLQEKYTLKNKTLQYKTDRLLNNHKKKRKKK